MLGFVHGSSAKPRAAVIADPWVLRSFSVGAHGTARDND